MLVNIVLVKLGDVRTCIVTYNLCLKVPGQSSVSYCMCTLLGCALYSGLCTVQVNTPTLCKLIMTDSCPPVIAIQGNMYIGL